MIMKGNSKFESSRRSRKKMSEMFRIQHAVVSAWKSVSARYYEMRAPLFTHGASGSDQAKPSMKKMPEVLHREISPFVLRVGVSFSQAPNKAPEPTA